MEYRELHFKVAHRIGEALVALKVRSGLHSLWGRGTLVVLYI